MEFQAVNMFVLSGTMINFLPKTRKKRIFQLLFGQYSSLMFLNIYKKTVCFNSRGYIAVECIEYFGHRLPWPSRKKIMSAYVREELCIQIKTVA